MMKISKYYQVARALRTKMERYGSQSGPGQLLQDPEPFTNNGNTAFVQPIIRMNSSSNRG